MERGKGSIALCFHVNGRYGPASIADCQVNLSGLSLRRDSILVDFVHHTGRHREKGEGDYKDTLLVVYITSESASTTFDVFHLT